MSLDAVATVPAACTQQEKKTGKNITKREIFDTIFGDFATRPRFPINNWANDLKVTQSELIEFLLLQTVFSVE